MWFRVVSYLKFLVKSTNEHGVHSPFVYNYVTKCLYSKKRLDRNKSINILLKTIAYFKFESISIPDKPEIQDLVRQHFGETQFDKKIIHLLFVDGLDTASFKKMFSEETLRNNSIILIDSIYKCKESLNLWHRLIAQPEITVSIDMYHCGLISIRKEQVKEHFTIRI